MSFVFFPCHAHTVCDMHSSIEGGKKLSAGHSGKPNANLSGRRRERRISRLHGEMGDWLQRATPWLDIVHMWVSGVPKHDLGSSRGCSGVKARPWLLYLASRWRAAHSQTCQYQRCFSKVHSDCSQTSVMVTKTSRKRCEGSPEACKAHWTAPGTAVGQ